MTQQMLLSEKEAYESALEADLREMSRQLEVLRSRTAGVAIGARIALACELSRLTDHRTALQRRLDELRRAGEDRWSRLCDGLDTIRNELADGLESLADQLRSIPSEPDRRA